MSVDGPAGPTAPRVLIAEDNAAMRQTLRELLEDEGLEAWTVSEVWLGASPRADHCVDVTDVFDRKLAALRSHVTQVSHMPDLEGMLRGWMGMTAQRFGLPEGRLAEAFHVVHTA